MNDTELKKIREKVIKKHIETLEIGKKYSQIEINNRLIGITILETRKAVLEEAKKKIGRFDDLKEKIFKDVEMV